MYPELFSIGPITIYTYGVLLAASYLLGLQFARVRARRWGLDPNRVLDLGIYIIIAALVGAKLLLLVTDFNQFRATAADLLSFARSAGVFYGGLIAAIAVAFWYIHRPVSYTHLRAHETPEHLVCRLLLEKKKK